MKNILIVFLIAPFLAFSQTKETWLMLQGGGSKIIKVTDSDNSECGACGNLDYWDLCDDERNCDDYRTRYKLTLDNSSIGIQDPAGNITITTNNTGTGTVIETQYVLQYHKRKVKKCGLLGKYTVEESCTYIGETSSSTIKVYDVIVEAGPTAKNSAVKICKKDSPFDLSSNVTVTGGQFYINGTAITGSTFNPSNYSAGTYTVMYRKVYYNAGNKDIYFTVQVIDNPVISASSYAIRVCANEPSFSLSNKLKPSPGGGTWRIGQNSLTDFDPSKNSGTVTVTYEVKDNNSCVSTKDFRIQIVASPTVSVSQIAQQCANGKNIALTGNPSQWYLISSGSYTRVGSWSGPLNSIKVSSASPAIDSLIVKNLPVGISKVTYTYTDNLGCSAKADLSVTIVDTARASITGTSLCSNGTDLNLNTLVGAAYQGGTWSGSAAINGTTFTPSKAKIGNNTIYYTYSNTSGCKSIQRVDIEVLSGNITFSGNFNSEILCNNTSAFDLNSVVKPFPTNGTWSGIAVKGSIFDVASLPSGTSSVTLTYTVGASNGTGCNAIKTKTYKIVNGTKVSAGNPITLCKNAKTIVLNGLPSQWFYVSQGGKYYKVGKWQGKGVVSVSDAISNAGVNDTINVPKDSLNPLLSESGQLVYSYNSGNCISTATVDLIIKDTANLTVTNLSELCLNNAPITLNDFINLKGGSWSGTGVANGIFNPAQAGAGSSKILYTYKDATTGCTSRLSVPINIKSLPVITGNFSDKEICNNGQMVNLYTEITPNFFNGQFSANQGVQGYFFNPTQVFFDTMTVYYSYTDATTQCTAKKGKKYLLNRPDEISISKLDEVCKNQKKYLFRAIPEPWTGTTKRGVWSGQSLKASKFPTQTDSLILTAIPADEYKYVYTYTNAKGCISKDSLLLTIKDTASVFFGVKDSVICRNNTPFELAPMASPAGGSFQLDGSIVTTFYPLLADSGRNVIRYIYTSEGCQSTIIKNLFVQPNPKISGDFVSTLDRCLNDTIVNLNAVVNISPTGGTWSGSSAIINNYQFDPSKGTSGAGTITYTVNNVYGCKESKDKYINLIGVPSAPTIQEANGKNYGCFNDTLNLVANVNSIYPYQYFWYQEDSLRSFYTKKNLAFVAKRNERLYVKSSYNGCRSGQSAFFNVVTINVKANFTANKTFLQKGDAVLFTETTSGDNISSYAWDFGDGTLGMGTNPAHYYYDTGRVAVKLTVVSEKGCTTEVSKQNYIRIIGDPDNNPTFGEGNDFTFASGDDNYIQLYPNPVTDRINLKIFVPISEAQVQIEDSKGVTVFRKDYFNLMNTQISLEDMPQGVYLLRLKDLKKGQEIKYKVIKN